MNFRQFIEQNTVGKHNDFATASYLPSAWTASDFSQSTNIDISIPTTTKKSQIRSIEKNKNPIVVSLMDGTKLYLTIDQFNRIKSKKNLDKGSEISVTFQRRPEDTNLEPSKIIDIS